MNKKFNVYLYKINEIEEIAKKCNKKLLLFVFWENLSFHATFVAETDLQSPAL